MIPSLEFSQKLYQAYQLACHPLCQAYRLPQTALDILLFLANNPEYHTARDIVEVRKLKANLVSVNIARLVTDGYLTRSPIPGDRRKVALALTDQALPIVTQGQALQQEFFSELFRGVSPADQAVFHHVLDAMALAEKYGKNKYVWRDNVENFILLKSNEEYFTDPVCKNGYFRGIETYNFVRDITSRFEQYKKKIKK